MIGELIGGRYALLARLGSGGTSSVWKARDAETDRLVAVKLLHVDGADSPDAVARFEREARLLAKVQGTNVIELLDRGETDGRPYLVFELVDGIDLRERLRRDGPLPLPAAVAIGEQIANGLAAAHAGRCIHRDLKPGNVLLADDGHVRVGDFGIARALEEPGLTQPGRVLGTGEYVSPEQALGKNLDARSDLYSLGVVLYEMLAGRPPFRGTGFADVAARHVKTPAPPVRRARPDAPAALADLVRGLLEKSPEDRPQDAVGVRDTLRAILAETALTDPAAEHDAVIVHALDPIDDAPEAPTADEPVAAVSRMLHLDDLAPWEDVTPPSMDFPMPRRPSAPVESAPYRVPSSARRNSGGLRWLAVLALGVALGGVAFVIQLEDNSGTNATASAPETTTQATAPPTTSAPVEPVLTGSATPLAVEDVSTFDPGGDGSENDDQAVLARDGDSSTWWETENYRSDANLADGKGGVGLVLTLTETSLVKEVLIQTPQPGFAVTVYTSRLAAAPKTLSVWKIASEEVAISRRRQKLTLTKPMKARFVLIWITRLAPADGGGNSARLTQVNPLG